LTGTTGHGSNQNKKQKHEKIPMFRKHTQYPLVTPPVYHHNNTNGRRDQSSLNVAPLECSLKNFIGSFQFEKHGGVKMPYRAYGKCGFCDKWMTKKEAEESQWGAEDRDDLLCDGCWDAPDEPETQA